MTKNSAISVAKCIKSVLWADEIVVVDAYSTDNTREIAAQAGARVVEKEWEGISLQQEFALLQTLCEWVLMLDPDEEVSKELKAEILHHTQQRGIVHGFKIARKHLFLGMEMKHGGWSTEYQLRLFKKSSTRMMYYPAHSGFVVDGTVGMLRSFLTHHIASSLHHYIGHMNEHTTYSVRGESDDGLKTNLVKLLASPLIVFVRRYIVQFGFMDRLPGFLSAYYASLETLMMHAKRWEQQKLIRV
ncbi:MAG: glycosyltransferase family 2 protein [Bacteroidota bacterium]